MQSKSKQLLNDLMDRLDKARLEKQAMQRELTEFEAVIAGLQQSIKLMLAKIESQKTAAPEIQAASTSKENMDAIIKILRLNGKGMRRKDIASRAYKLGLISSTKGYEGVDAIIGNTLSRNEPRLFVNTGWGWWDLAERQRSEHGEPLRFPREKESKTETQKTIQ